MKLHKGAADLLADVARRNGRPVTATFQVTDRCNYDCVHCYQDHEDNDELSFDEISSILSQLADAGVLFLTLMGGEFFMRRDADDILRRAHELGFAIKLLTTGHHVHDKRADFLATMKPLQVDMSLYAATPHVHEGITKQSGSWERTYSAARRLIERGIPVLLKAPVMESNAADLEALAVLARELGAQTSFDAKITGKEDTDQTPVALRMSADTLGEFYCGEGNGMAAFLRTTYEGFDPQTSNLRPLNHTPCRAGQQAVSINPRGDVWPCNALPVVCGNLRSQTFEEIWTGSEELDEVRDLRWAKISECNKCELRSYCQRCHGMALLEQGDMQGPSLEACRHAVAVRDALRTQGVIPPTETAMPPTWDRVDRDGRHDRPEQDDGIRRSSRLRVVQ
jgi:radical SAM protein with 4Fe4S-binding SPASM domain